jgi:hypothetical protein
MKVVGHDIGIAKLHNAKFLTVHVIPFKMKLGAYSYDDPSSASPEASLVSRNCYLVVRLYK